MSKELESLERIENEYSIDEAVFYKEDFKQVRKGLKALEIIKRFIWVEDGKLNCGRYCDVEIELDEEDFEDEEELNLLKEVLE